MTRRRHPTSLLLIAGSVAAAVSSGCGSGPSSGNATHPRAASHRAAVAAGVQTYPERDEAYDEPTGVTIRRITFHVRPLCDDGSGALDCTGTYTMVAQYRYRAGKPSSLRCGARQNGVGFSQDGFIRAAVALSSADATVPVECVDAEPGTLWVESTVPMGDTDAPRASFGDRLSPSFQVTMRIDVGAGGAVRYSWRGRDGARCEGRMKTTAGVQRFDCRWS